MRFACGLALSGLLAAGCAHAAGESPANQLERYLADLATWSADFKQTIDDAQGKVLSTASGHLYLQRPGRFRWDYVLPSAQLVLADGKELWFYDKDLAQANVRKLDAGPADTPAMLLSGGSTVGSQFDIAALPAAEGLDWYQLTPKRPNSDFQAVRIGFDRGQLVRMLLADKLNQVTRLDFSAAKRNVKLAPELFSFTPPAGVDVIGRDAK